MSIQIIVVRLFFTILKPYSRICEPTRIRHEFTARKTSPSRIETLDETSWIHLYTCLKQPSKSPASIIRLSYQEWRRTIWKRQFAQPRMLETVTMRLKNKERNKFKSVAVIGHLSRREPRGNAGTNLVPYHIREYKFASTSLSVKFPHFLTLKCSRHFRVKNRLHDTKASKQRLESPCKMNRR